jgi:ankyrin repeat protein
MLQHGADPNQSDGSKIPPLHRAVQTQMTSLVKALLARGADVNARVPAAARQWSGEARGGARALTPVPVGATPFVVAAWTHNAPLMRDLLAAGADPRVTTADQTTALMVAAGVSGRPPMGFSRKLETPDMLEAVNVALERGDDVNAVNGAGQTAMHGAATLGSTELIQLLADKGAKADVKDHQGRTPLSIATRTENRAMGTPPNKAVIELLTRLTTGASAP